MRWRYRISQILPEMHTAELPWPVAVLRLTPVASTGLST